MSTLTDLTSEITSVIDSNSARDVTAAKVRQVLTDMATRILGDVASISAGSGATVGDSTANFPTRASAVTATIAGTGAGGPTYIRTAGYLTAGDGGQGLYTRVSSTPSYSNLVWFSSADGQKWGLVVTNDPLKPEQAGGGVSASGAANLAAVDALQSLFYSGTITTPSGYAPAGPCIQFGFGTYNFSGPWRVRGGCNIRGLGSGAAGGYATQLKFPAGSDGIVLGTFNTNGRLYNVALYGGTYACDGTVIRDMDIRGGWVLNGTTPYSQNNSTGERGIGILVKCPAQLENLHISGFAEFGVYTKGSSGGGGSATEPAPGTGDNTDSSESYVCSEGRPNNFLYVRVFVETCGCDGFRDKGADANNGSYIECSSATNYAWGFNNLCFLGNNFWGCHTTTNGFRWFEQSRHDTTTGVIPGPYQAADDSNTSAFIACYSESDHDAASNMRGHSIFIGGLHAAGVVGSFSNFYNGGSGGASISSFTTNTPGGSFSVGNLNVTGEILNHNGEVFLRKQFNRFDTGTFSNAALQTITLSGYPHTMGRASALGSGKLLFQYGHWLGPGEDEARFRGVYDGFPSSGQFARGDHFDLMSPSAGGAWGYVCTTGGDYSGTPPVWKSKGNLAA